MGGCFSDLVGITAVLTVSIQTIDHHESAAASEDEQRWPVDRQTHLLTRGHCQETTNIPEILSDPLTLVFTGFLSSESTGSRKSWQADIMCSLINLRRVSSCISNIHVLLVSCRGSSSESTSTSQATSLGPILKPVSSLTGRTEEAGGLCWLELKWKAHTDFRSESRG